MNNFLKEDILKIQRLMGVLNKNLETNLITNKKTPLKEVNDLKYQQSRIIKLMDKLNNIVEDVNLQTKDEMMVDLTNLDQSQSGKECIDLAKFIEKSVKIDSTITFDEVIVAAKKAGFSEQQIDMCSRLEDSYVAAMKNVYRPSNEVDAPTPLADLPGEPKTITEWENKNGGKNMLRYFSKFLIYKSLKEFKPEYFSKLTTEEEDFIDYQEMKYQSLVKMGAAFNKENVDLSNTKYSGYQPNSMKSVPIYKIPDKIKGWSGKDIVRCFEWIFDFENIPDMPSSLDEVLSAGKIEECSCDPGYVDCGKKPNHPWCQQKYQGVHGIRKETITCPYNYQKKICAIDEVTWAKYNNPEYYDQLKNQKSDLGKFSDWVLNDVGTAIGSWTKKNYPDLYAWYQQEFKPFITGWGGVILSVACALLAGVALAIGGPVLAVIGTAAMVVGMAVDFVEALIYLIDDGDPLLGGIVFIFGILGLDMIKGEAKVAVKEVLEETVPSVTKEGVSQETQKKFIKRLAKEGLLESAQKIATDPQNWKNAASKILKESFKTSLRAVRWTLVKAARVLIWLIKKGFLLSWWLTKTAVKLGTQLGAVSVTWGTVCLMLGILPEKYMNLLNGLLGPKQIMKQGKSVEVDPLKGYIDDYAALLLSRASESNYSTAQISNSKTLVIAIQEFLKSFGYKQGIITPEPWSQKDWVSLDKRFRSSNQSDFNKGKSYIENLSIKNAGQGIALFEGENLSSKKFIFKKEDGIELFTILVFWRTGLSPKSKSFNVNNTFDIAAISKDKSYDNVLLKIMKYFEDLEDNQLGYQINGYERNSNGHLQCGVVGINASDFMITMKKVKELCESYIKTSDYDGATTITKKLKELQLKRDAANDLKYKVIDVDDPNFEGLVKKYENLPPIAGYETMSDIESGKVKLQEVNFTEGKLDKNVLDAIKYFKVLNGLPSDNILDKITIDFMLMEINLNFGYDLVDLLTVERSNSPAKSKDETIVSYLERGRKKIKYDRKKFENLLDDDKVAKQFFQPDLNIREKVTLESLLAEYQRTTPTPDKEAFTKDAENNMKSLENMSPEEIIEKTKSWKSTWDFIKNESQITDIKQK